MIFDTMSILYNLNTIIGFYYFYSTRFNMFYLHYKGTKYSFLYIYKIVKSKVK